MGIEVEIGDFLHRIKRPIKLDGNKKYKLVTIKMKHKGVVLRREKLGAEIKSKMYEVKEGDFILSGIDARNGAFGIIPKELDGAIVTNDFWYFDIDEKIVDKRLFLELTSTQWFDEICRKGSDGTTQRIRLQKNKFFNQQIELPPIDEQEEFISRFKENKNNNDELKTELTHQQTLLKKLRQQILQEAIEGKLTADWRADNPDIEPASELLAHIQAEKAQLIKDKKIKKQKPLPPISEEEKPFGLPDGWVWCRLGEVVQLNPRNKIDDGLSVSFIPMRMIEDEYKNRHKSEIKKWIDIKTGFTHFAENDVVVAKITPCFQNRKSAVLKNLENKYGAGTTEIFVLRDYANTFLSELVLFTVKTSKFIEKGVNTYKGTVGQQRVQKSFIEKYIVALPPLPEQKAIVTKVEKLLTLCDQLQTQITHNQSHANALMQAVLKEAFTSEATEQATTHA